jgi:hypothetical protein
MTDQDGDVILEDASESETMNIVIIPNCIKFGSDNKSAAISFYPNNNALYIGSANPQNCKVDAHFQGKIFFDNGRDLSSELQNMMALIQQQQWYITHLEQKINEIYYAPNMPGYFTAQEEYMHLNNNYQSTT